MKKIILKESSFKRLLEYVGDEEEFGRYDIEPDNYKNMPSDEGMSVNRKNMESDDVVSFPLSADDWEDIQYLGMEFNDPGPYSEYKKRDYVN